MTKNTLYNFINTYVAKGLRTPYEGTSLVRAKNLQQIDYFRFELMKPQETVLVGAYELNSAHISVYFDIVDGSEFHWTGYFTHDEQAFQAHVYFKNDGELTDSPKFSRMHTDVREALSLETTEQLEHLARSAYLRVLSQIRSKLSTKIQSLKERYNQLEKEASLISERMPLSYHDYTLALSAMLASLRELIPLVKDDKKYKGIEAFISKMQVICQRLSDLECNAPAASVASDIPVIHSNEELLDKQLNEISLEPLKPDALQLPRKENLDQQISVLCEKFKQFPRNASNLYDFFIESNDYALLLMDPSRYEASIDSWQKLYKLDYMLRREGEAMLRGFLKKNQYDTIQLLSPFFFTLTIQDIIGALEGKNAQKLRFLLTTGLFELNGHALKIGPATYDSAVHYCFENPKDMAPCFSVLIEQGMSILVNYHGQSIAYQLLSTANHPLTPALTSTDLCRQKTVGSPIFYKRLITELKGVRCLDEKTRLTVAKAIATYEEQISSLTELNYVSRRVAPSLAKSLQDQVLSSAAASSPVSLQRQEMQKMDPEMRALEKDIDRLGKKLLREHPRMQQAQIIKGYLKESREQLLNVSDDSEDKFSFVDYKEAFLENGHRKLQHLQRIERLLELKRKGSQAPMKVKKEAASLIDAVENFSEDNEALSGKVMTAPSLLSGLNQAMGTLFRQEQVPFDQRMGIMKDLHSMFRPKPSKPKPTASVNESANSDSDIPDVDDFSSFAFGESAASASPIDVIQFFDAPKRRSLAGDNQFLASATAAVKKS